MNKKIIKILEEELNMNFFDIIRNVSECEVRVNEELIKNYLYKKLIEDTLVNNKRIDDIETDNNYINYLLNVKYRFEPYTLIYFKRMITILKSKSLNLLEIIYKLTNDNKSDIKDILSDIDLTLDIKGKISYIEAKRLLKPTIYNINKLFQITNEANNIETYLKFKLNKEQIYMQGLNENDYYPSNSLQYKSFDFIDNIDKEGYISLTDKQKKDLNFYDAVNKVR